MAETAMKLDNEMMSELQVRAEKILADEKAKIGKDKKVTVKFNKLVGNMHATKDVLDSLTHMIRFSDSRKFTSSYLLGYSLPNEENEKAAMFLREFGQNIIFYPDQSYTIPLSEAKKYQKMLGTYKEIYKDGPMFFQTQEDYSRSLDVKQYVEIQK